MTIAINSGVDVTKVKNYSSSSAGLTNVRPGMGYYRKNSHAMIIVDVHYDKNGNTDKFKVAESNNCGGKNYPYQCLWVNPVGQIPWERKVTNTREETNLKYIIVNFEK